jgi:hypothetical protein
MRERAYNVAERALHHLALGSQSIAEIAFDLNGLLTSTENDAAGDQRHVFVAGLARAGTTIVMRRLHETGLFRSLTYRDMPFVLCPNLWERLSSLSRRDIEAVERAHGDRLTIDADSPEALDEVFWRVFAGPDYIKADHLSAHDVPPELIERFRHYVSCILRSQNRTGRRRRYLSKNNNNILRLKALQTAYPSSIIVIPFRDPGQHANSLRNQHLKFRRMQDEDRFARTYMKWLAHHEFGLEHKPFWLEAGRPFAVSSYAADSINYWLETWLRIYEWLRRNRPGNSVLVCYEDLCSDPTVWSQLLARLGIERGPQGADQPFSRAADKQVSDVDSCLLAEASDLYRALRQEAARPAG